MKHRLDEIFSRKAPRRPQSRPEARVAEAGIRFPKADHIRIEIPGVFVFLSRKDLLSSVRHEFLIQGVCILDGSLLYSTQVVGADHTLFSQSVLSFVPNRQVGSTQSLTPKQQGFIETICESNELEIFRKDALRLGQIESTGITL